MGWLKSILGIKWVPYAVILAVSVTGGATLWGYMKGVSSTEKKWMARMNQALAVQLEEFQRVSAADLETVVKTNLLEAEIKNHAENTPFPEIDPHCRDVMFDWMREFNGSIGTINSAAGID